MTTRKFPVGNATPQKYVKLPIDDEGRPLRDSAAWKTMIANAVARSPATRSPAERSALRSEGLAVSSPLYFIVEYLDADGRARDCNADTFDSRAEAEAAVPADLAAHAWIKSWRIVPHRRED